MYNVFWKNISRAETALWGFIAVYYGIIGSLFLYRLNFGSEKAIMSSSLISILLILIVSIFFSMISFNLNLWFLRNMELISRIEKDLLEKNDLDSIIPKSWVLKERKFFNLEFYCLFSFIFIIFGLFFSFIIMEIDNVMNNQISILKINEVYFFFLILIILIIFETLYIKFHLISRYKKLLKNSNKK